MEEVKTNADGMTNANGEGAEVNDREEKPEDRVAYSTYTKAMAQRARFKEDAEKLKEENESFKQKLLEAEGKKDEQISYWKKKASELEDRDKKRESQLAWTSISSQLKTELLAHGCVNPDKALRLIDREEISSIEVDDSYKVRSEDVKRIVEKIKQDNADIGLFRKGTGVKDMSPSSVNYDKTKEKAVSKLSKDELLSAWNNLV